MAPTQYMSPVADSKQVFKDGIFSGRVLFCTGGGSGICKELWKVNPFVCFVKMRHGADAVIVGRNMERLTQSAKELSEATRQKCIPAQADVRQPQQLQDAVKKTIETFGRIDFVICGAAGNFLAPIQGLSENGFRSVIEIDVLGTYNTVKATLLHVRKAKGSYIHTSATLHYRGTPYQVHVSSAKAGVDALSAVLAVEEGPHGVRSNVIAPGPIADTPGMDRLESKDPTSAANGLRSKLVPMGRYGDVQDIANAAVFLFSDAASWISGQILVVDGGFEHLRGFQFPYPQSVLDPKSVKAFIKPRL